MRERYKQLFTLAIIVLVLSVDADATIHYVSISGGITPPYTSWETAAMFFELANDASNEGDTIVVGPGTFQLSDYVLLKKGIVIKGQGIDITTIRGMHDTFSMFPVSDSTSVEGITFLADRNYRIFYKSYSAPAYSFSASNCRFVGGGSQIDMWKIRTLTVQNCIFDGWESGAAIVAGDSGNVLVENSTFTGMQDGFSVCDFDFSLGQRVFQNNLVISDAGDALSGDFSFGRLVVKNNVFYGPNWHFQLGMNAYGQYIEVANNSFFFQSSASLANQALLSGSITNDTLYFYNNIAAGFRPQIWIRGEVLPSVNINIYYNCFFSALPWDRSNTAPPGLSIPLPAYYDTIDYNILADPMLVDPWSGDLHLQQGSPCIDAGVPWLLDADGTRSDMGAFGGPAGNFYAYQDFAPATPIELVGERQSNRISLRWRPNTEADIRIYAVYRSQQLPVVANLENLIAEVGFDYFSVSDWSDRDSLSVSFIDSQVLPGPSYHYVIAAIDSNDLSSELSETASFIGTDADDEEQLPLPEHYSLEQNYPNPFNATTAIVYNLPKIGAQPAEVGLEIFNSLGQLVKTLISKHQMPGRQIAYWDGTDNTGLAVASGVYYYRLRVSGVDFAANRKMIVIK